MSREFIDAIASGDNLEAEDEFNNSISSKVGGMLEFRRKEIAQTFAGNNEEADLDEAGSMNLARALEPGGSLSKEKDTGKGWQNLNKVLAKKDTGKGWQNLNKVLAKKDEKPKKEKPYPKIGAEEPPRKKTEKPYPKIGAEEPPRKKPPFDIPPVVAEPSVGAKPPRQSPDSEQEKWRKKKTPKPPRRSPGALGGKRDEYDDTYGGP